MIEKLREINERLITKYENDDENLNKQLLIKEILKKDDCFLIIPIEVAYLLLQDLEYSNSEIPAIYESLI